jgi:hypothetical protein
VALATRCRVRRRCGFVATTKFGQGKLAVGHIRRLCV